MQTISIASGRGGVGKSVLAANLALALVNRNKRVIVVDLDLGSPSQHLLLGTSSVGPGLADFFAQPDRPLQELLRPGPQPGLSLIVGVGELHNAAEMPEETGKWLRQQLSSLPCDYVILDLSAGTRADTLDFFSFADRQILVATPTITSHTGAYLFLKNLVFRLLATRLPPTGTAARHLHELQQSGVALQSIHLLKLEQHLAEIDPRFRAQLGKEGIVPQLVLNMVHRPQDLSRAYKLCRTSREYLGLDLDYLGLLYYDNYQKMSMEARQPLLLFQPGTVLSQGIYRIASRTIRGKLASAELKESFQTAENEAKADLALKNLLLEEMMASDQLTVGELADNAQRNALYSPPKNRQLKRDLAPQTE